MTITTGRAARFRDGPTSRRLLHGLAASVIAALVALMMLGLLTPWTAIAFFAIGAGAGYSLSGSV